MAPATPKKTASVRDGRRAPVRATKRHNPVPELDGDPDLLGQYLRQIGATPLLDADDEVRLA
ncbi:sigma-70 factor domain-containing protein, partial [Streptomyces carpinensis]